MTDQIFALAFVDFDGELTLLKMQGASNANVARDFLCKQFPESVDELNELGSFEDLADWCDDCECQVDVFAVA